MTLAEQYRITAQEMKDRAESLTDVHLKTEFELLAQKYILLAEQAERNQLTDIVYETPLPLAPALNQSTQQQQPQEQQQHQQQQPQPQKTKSDE